MTSVSSGQNFVRPMRLASSVLITASLVAIGACSGVPLSLLPFRSTAASTPQVLSRCDPNPVALCLLTFGVDMPNQMLIALYSPGGSLQNLRMKVQYKGVQMDYPCRAVQDSLTVYCTGPQIPLGSTLSIDVYTAPGDAVMARGDFLINAFALPSIAIGGTPTSTRTPRATASKRPLRTLTPSAPRGSRTPTLGVTPPPSKTRTPGTGYPNP
jgi:hypothetical protein